MSEYGQKNHSNRDKGDICMSDRDNPRSLVEIMNDVLSRYVNIMTPSMYIILKKNMKILM